MKRAKLRGLRRNAAMVLGNIANPEDVLTRALDDLERIVHEHAARALQGIRDRTTDPSAQRLTIRRR